MNPKTRVNFTAQERLQLWARWRKGESLSEIGRALERHAATVYSVLLPHGGYTPRAKIRSARHLSLSEREYIFQGVTLGHSFRQMAEKLDRSPSTISREVDRNGGRQAYRVTLAEARANTCGLRPKSCWLTHHARLRQQVAAKLQQNWSPEQISGYLKLTYPDDKTLQISHETIYRSLFVQARGVLKKELTKHLRTQRTLRQSRHYNTKGSSRGQIKEGISIRARPAEIEDRAIPGHWEGDLIAGSKNTHIATLVERHSRFTLLVKVAGKDTKTVVSALTKKIKQFPEVLFQSLTWDRGMELANHRKLTLDTDMKVYFCDPKSPWQRGTNENTNRLLRQYFPKQTDLSIYSQTELNKVARQLNQRPRKTLGFKTPADKLQESVALTR